MRHGLELLTSRYVVTGAYHLSAGPGPIRLWLLFGRRIDTEREKLSGGVGWRLSRVEAVFVLELGCLEGDFVGVAETDAAIVVRVQGDVSMLGGIRLLLIHHRLQLLHPLLQRQLLHLILLLHLCLLLLNSPQLLYQPHILAIFLHHRQLALLNFTHLLFHPTIIIQNTTYLPLPLSHIRHLWRPQKQIRLLTAKIPLILNHTLMLIPEKLVKSEFLFA